MTLETPKNEAEVVVIRNETGARGRNVRVLTPFVAAETLIFNRN